MKVIIGNRIEMEVPRELLDLPTKGSEESFFSLSKTRINSLERGSYCYDQILSGKKGIFHSVLELFAGIGRYTRIIEDRISPNRITLNELCHEYCVHLHRIYPKAELTEEDTFKYIKKSFSTIYDLICIDPPFSTTIYAYLKELRFQELIKYGFDNSNISVLVTFVGLNKYPLLKKGYEKFYGKEFSSMEDYLKTALSHLVKYVPFQLERCYYSSKSFYALFTKGFSGEPLMEKIKIENYRGYFRVEE